MSRLTFLYLLFIVFWNGVIRAQEPGLQVVTLPIYLVNDYLVIVRGSIGGIEKRNLLIDTGANPTVITRDLAKRLQLSSSSEQVQAVGHNMNSQVVFVPSLEVGPIRVQNLRVLVQDLTEFDKKLGVHLDALVGLDVLAHSDFRVDYHQKKLIFGPVRPLPHSAPIHRAGFTASIDVQVEGQTLPLLLDTGAFDVMLFSERVAGLADKPGALWSTINLAGHFAVRQVRLTRLEADGSDLGPREAFVTDRQNAERYPYGGLLALGSERFRQIGFDFEHRVFSWEPAKSRNDNHRIPRGSALALASPAPGAAPYRAGEACTADLSGGSTASCGDSAELPGKRLPLPSR